MKAIFNLMDISIGSSREEWWLHRDRLQFVLECMDSVGMLVGVKYAGLDGGDLIWQEFKSMSHLLILAENWVIKPFSNYRLSVSPNIESEVEILMAFGPGWLGIKLIIDDIASKPKSSRFDSCLDFLMRLHRAVKHEFVIGPIVNIAPYNLEISQARPPRRFQRIVKYSMVDAYCKKYFAEDEDVRDVDREEVDKLLSLKLPEWVDRREEGDLVILRWVDDFSDVDHIRDRMTRRLNWLIENLDPPIDSNFNEQGDQRANPMDTIPLDGLTFYDSLTGHGYKATVCPENGSVDETLFERMNAWVVAGELPSGETLHAIHLLLPNRDAALRAHNAPKKYEAGKVLYIGGDENFWDPFPEGNWLEE